MDTAPACARASVALITPSLHTCQTIQACQPLIRIIQHVVRPGVVGWPAWDVGCAARRCLLAPHLGLQARLATLGQEGTVPFLAEPYVSWGCVLNPLDFCSCNHMYVWEAVAGACSDVSHNNGHLVCTGAPSQHKCRVCMDGFKARYTLGCSTACAGSWMPPTPCGWDAGHRSDSIDQGCHLKRPKKGRAACVHEDAHRSRMCNGTVCCRAARLLHGPIHHVADSADRSWPQLQLLCHGTHPGAAAGRLGIAWWLNLCLRAAACSTGTGAAACQHVCGMWARVLAPRPSRPIICSTYCCYILHQGWPVL